MAYENFYMTYNDNNEFSEIFLKVKVNGKLTCHNTMEVPYYSCGLFEDEVCFICGVHCENVILDNDKDHYYYCEECSKKESDKKKRSKSFFAPNSRKKRRA